MGEETDFKFGGLSDMYNNFPFGFAMGIIFIWVIQSLREFYDDRKKEQIKEED